MFLDTVGDFFPDFTVGPLGGGPKMSFNLAENLGKPSLDISKNTGEAKKICIFASNCPDFTLFLRYFGPIIG